MLTLRQLSFLLFLSTVCWAQTPSDVAPAAPVPVQISTAKKIFISNAQGESTAMTAFPNQTYNEFYADEGVGPLRTDGNASRCRPDP